MRVLHVCFGSYTLLTGNRLLYSVGNGNKSTDAADENGRSAQFVCIAKRRSGLCGGGQLLGPCRLASGLSLRGTLPFGAQERNRKPLQSNALEPSKWMSVQYLGVALQMSTRPRRHRSGPP
jgi:hypothetical protein